VVGIEMILGCGLPCNTIAHSGSGSDEERAVRSDERGAESLDCALVLFTDLRELREVLPKGAVVHKLLAEMIREMVEAFVDAKMDRADISVALCQVAADVGGPALIKRINRRSRKTVEAMLETASDIKSPPDKFAIDIMLSAIAGAMRSMLEAGPSPATVRKAREQLVLLCQSYMAAATAKRV
jgi:hypothetical protein